jgi:protein arginine kinase activator
MHGDCQICGKRAATVHLIEVPVAGAPRQEAHICPACVESLGLDLHTDPPPVATILAAKAAAGEPAKAKPRAQRPGCPTCGFAIGDYNASNLFGCPDCYDAFTEQIDALLRRYHGTTEHCGRMPGTPAEPADPDADAVRVRRIAIEASLRDAIAAERFEEAASLRDALRRLGAPAGPAA